MIVYYSGGSVRKVLEAERDDLRIMLNKDMGNVIPTAQRRALENGCFAKGASFDDVAWLDWIDGQPRAACDFAVVPDVLCDAMATALRSAKYLGPVREMGHRPAFVLQNGAIDELVPWSRFDVLFVGGDDAFKLGWTARHFVAEAHARGKSVHMGRVNSRRRMVDAWKAGYDSVDGTYLAFGPDTNFPKLIGWLDDLNRPVELEAM